MTDPSVLKFGTSFWLLRGPITATLLDPFRWEALEPFIPSLTRCFLKPILRWLRRAIDVPLIEKKLRTDSAWERQLGKFPSREIFARRPDAAGNVCKMLKR